MMVGRVDRSDSNSLLEGEATVYFTDFWRMPSQYFLTTPFTLLTPPSQPQPQRPANQAVQITPIFFIIYSKLFSLNFHSSQNIEYSMQKIPQIPTTKTLLPCIYGQSKRNFRSISHQHRKENIHTENSCSEKYQHQGSSVRFSKKCSLASVHQKIGEVREAGGEERQGGGIHTRRKISRPWVDREIDFNKETIKNEQLQCLLKQHTLQQCKTKINKKTMLQEAADVTLVNLTKTKEMILTKTRNFRIGSDRNDSGTKQKISSCKIAMKKGVFPLNRQHYEQLKVSEYFQREDAISAISHRECGEVGEQFISRESLLNIVF